MIILSISALDDDNCAWPLKDWEWTAIIIQKYLRCTPLGAPIVHLDDKCV